MVILLLASNVYSQDKGYIAVSLGPSIPTGDFASKDMDNNSAGFAKTGAIFDISFRYKLKNNFGVTAILRGQANQLDAQAIADEMSNKFGISGTVKTNSWGIGGLLVGGYSTIPVAKQLTFESRLMIGFVTASSPDISINFNIMSESGWVKQNTVTSSAFAYLAGVGLKYDAGKRVCLLANIDYLGAKPKFKDVETAFSDGTLEKDTFTQQFGSVNVGVGIGYRL
jgi:hypothetical protein